MVTYTDSFTRSDTTSGLGVIPGGPTWEVLRGSWRISGQKPYTSDSNSTDPLAVAEFETPNVDLSMQTAYGGDAVYFRVLNSSNWLRARRRGYSSTSSSQQPVYATRTVYTYKTEYQYNDIVISTQYEWRCNYGTSWNHSVGGITKTGSSYPSGSAGCPTSITHSHTVYTNAGDPRYNERHSHMYSSWSYQGSTQQYSQVGTYWATSKRGSEDTATGSSRQVVSGSYEETYISHYETVYDTDYHYRVYLEKCVNGSISTISNTTATSSTTTLRVVAEGTSIQVYVGSTLEISTTDSTHSTRTKHGFGRGDSSRNSQNLDNFSISVANRPPNTPMLQVPNGGEVWDEVHTINWTSVTDPDGDSVTYTVQLSTDNGATWSTLGTSSSSSMSYNFVNVPETSQARIRVRSSDGSLVSSWDTGGAFEIDHRVELALPGEAKPTNFYVGSTLVTRIYVGDTLVFGKEPE